MTAGVRAEWWRPLPAGAGVPLAASAAPVSRGVESSRLAFVALLAFLVVLFVSPQSFIPGLAALRIALLAAAVGIGTHLYDRISRQQPLSVFPTQLWIALALGVWALVSVPMSLWPGGSLTFLMDGYFKTLMIFWLLINVVTSAERLVRVGWVLSLSACLLGYTAVRNFMSGNFINLSIDIKRIAGYDAPLTQNPNDMALLLNLILPLTVTLFLREARPLLRVVLLGSILVSIVGVVATFSRAGFLTLAAIFIAYLIKLRGRRESRFVWGLLIAALVAMPFLPAHYFDRLSTITATETDTTGSAQIRSRDIVVAMGWVLANPIVGAGAGQDALALNQMRGAKWAAVHNTYLEYAVDLGLPGVTLFLLLLFGAVRCAAFVRRHARGRPQYRDHFYLAEGLQISLIAYMVAANFQPGGYHFTFYVFAGLAIALKGVYVNMAGAAA